MLTHMRTTIELPEPLFKRAKETAKRRGITLRRLLEEALREHLTEGPPAPFKLRDASFRGEGLVSGIDWTDFERMRELL